jgi:hypothetical protein
MGGASAFIWVMVVILGLAWALTQTGTVNLGVNFNLWVNLLLVLAVLGVVFNLFVVPFLGRSRTMTSSARTEGTSVGTPATPAAGAPPAATPAEPVATTAPHSGAASQEVVHETRDSTTL